MHLTLITALATLATLTLAHPFSLRPRQSSTAPPGFPGSASPNTTSTPSTTITYYQKAAPNPSTCGGIAVSTGTLNASYCMQFHTYSAMIAQVPDDECVFTLFRGSRTCGSGEGGSVERIVVPAGGGETCIVSGVLDGGLLEGVSGFWVCE